MTWGGESSIAAAIEVLERRGARPNRVATIGPVSVDQHAALSAKFEKLKSLNRDYIRLRPGEVRRGARLAAHRRTF